MQTNARPAPTPSELNRFAERPSAFPWAPVVFLGAALLAIALHIVQPLPWFGSPFADLLLAIGVLVATCGLALYGLAIRVLARAKTTLMPHHAAKRLVTNGPYALSRNPIDLGATLVLLGIGLASGILWFLPLAILAAFLVQHLAIRGEEAHCEARFGKAWRDYAKRVRRWV